MRRVLCFASFFLLVGARDARATTLAQDCSGGTFIVSAVVVTGSAIYDIATAPASARHYNEQHVSIEPLLDVRHRSFGLSVSLSLGRSSRVAARPARPARLVADSARKSPALAFVLSFASTAVPMAAGVALGSGAGLFLGGLIIGPSVGHFYAGQSGRGLGTIALRAAGTVIGLNSIVDCIDD